MPNYPMLFLWEQEEEEEGEEEDSKEEEEDKEDEEELFEQVITICNKYLPR